MDTIINYSFIIPHHNSPSLLNRCINSIPIRDDIEIIVVDDNSDVEKCPQIVRDNVNLLFLNAEQTRGAGKARNVGLEHARGKWLLFADADDYYSENIDFVLDKYIDKVCDVIYFNANITDIREGVFHQQKNTYSEVLLMADKDQRALDEVKYVNTQPWNKLVYREFVEKHNIRFEEIMQGNDIYFSIQVGFFARNILIENKVVYNYFFQSATITNRNWTVDKFICNIENIYKSNGFKLYMGYPEWQNSPMKRAVKLILKNGSMAFSFILAFICHYSQFQELKDYYVKKMNAN